MKIYILATCRTPDSLFGAATCVFDTLRIGFPTADIRVYDNASIPEASAALIKGAMKTKTTYALYTHRMLHHEWISMILDYEKLSEEPIVFLDPDVIFWDNIEKLLEYTSSFGRNLSSHFLAGRYIPAFYNEVVCAKEFDRLHTSLLLITNPKGLHNYIKKVVHQTPNYPFDPIKPFQTYMYGENREKYFSDTCCQLFQLMGGYHFDPEILDCYSHLGCGSMLDLVADKMLVGEQLKQLHKEVEKNPLVAKDLWREQEAYYKQHAIS